MGAWWTYRPEDFLLFSERVYWRLFLLHNEALWPLQVPVLLLGAAAFGALMLRRSWSVPFAAGLLAGAWVWVAWSFFWQRYATINWTAPWVALAFAAQALLLVAVALARPCLGQRRGIASIAGLALFVWALFVHPLVPLLSGRPFAEAEVAGLTPDPTAIATLGCALSLRGAFRWLLLPIPLLWCLASWLTLNTMGAWEAWIPLLAAATAVVIAGVEASTRRRTRAAP